MARERDSGRKLGSVDMTGVFADLPWLERHDPCLPLPYYLPSPRRLVRRISGLRPASIAIPTCGCRRRRYNTVLAFVAAPATRRVRRYPVPTNASRRGRAPRPGTCIHDRSFPSRLQGEAAQELSGTAARVLLKSRHSFIQLICLRTFISSLSCLSDTKVCVHVMR